MESYPYTKPMGVGPVTTKLTPGAEPASRAGGRPLSYSCLIADFRRVRTGG